MCNLHKTLPDPSVDDFMKGMGRKEIGHYLRTQIRR